MNDDPELLRQYVQTGSQPAFTALVDRYVNLVYSAALRRSNGNPHRAEEITQSVFVALAYKARFLEHHSSLAGWLYTCSRNAAIDALRADYRHTKLIQEAAMMEPTAFDRTPEPDWERLRPVLDQAMDEIGAHDREAILLRFFENRSYSEIGKTLSIAADAARMRVDRALDRLRGRLGRRGIESTSAALGVALAQHAVAAAPRAFAASLAGTALVPATGLTPAAGLLSLMSMTKVGLGIGGLFVALALGVATFQVFATRSLNQELAAATALNAAATSRLNALTRQSLKASALATAAPHAPAPSAPVRSRATNAAANGLALTTAHPELRLIIDGFVKAAIDAKYRDLYASLGLSPSQILQLEGHFGKEFSFAYGFNGVRYTFTPSFAATNEPPEDSKALEQILGAQGMQQYQAFEKTDFARKLTAELATSASAVDSPLAPDQISALNTALAPFILDSAGGFDWTKAAASAATLLTPPQLTVFNALRQQVQVNVAINAAAKHE